MMSKRKIKSILFLAAALSLFGLFAALSEEVIFDRVLDVTDQKIAAAVYAIRTPELTSVFTAFTTLGSAPWVVLISVIVIIIMIAFKRRSDVLPLLSALVGASIFALIFKNVFARPRPLLTHALVSEIGFSFPSGHTLIGICLYGVLIYFTVRALHKWWQKIVVSVVGVLLVLAIGFSRIYLGVHWPTDVLASLLLGSSWLFMLAAIFQYYPEIRKKLM